MNTIIVATPNWHHIHIPNLLAKAKKKSRNDLYFTYLREMMCTTVKDCLEVESLLSEQVVLRVTQCSGLVWSIDLFQVDD